MRGAAAVGVSGSRKSGVRSTPSTPCSISANTEREKEREVKREKGGADKQMDRETETKRAREQEGAHTAGEARRGQPHERAVKRERLGKRPRGLAP